MTKHNLLGHLLAFGTIMIWGVTYSSTKILLQVISPLQIIFMRFLLAYVLLWIIYPHRLKLNSLHQELQFVIAGLSGVTVYFLCENIAIDYTSASLVGILVAVAPILTGILTQIFFHKKMKPLFAVGFVLAMFGVIAVTSSGLSDMGFSWIGIALAIGAPVAWAVYSTIIAPISIRNYPPLAQTRRIFFYGVLFLLPVLIIRREPMEITPMLEPIYIVHFLFLALLGSTLGYITWNKAIQILGSIKTTAYVYLSPVVSLIFGIILLNEPFTFLEGLGIVLILIGLILSELPSLQMLL